jgi:energy-coupling factor transport system substrate-specific component
MDESPASNRALANAVLLVISAAGLLTFALPFILSAAPLPAGSSPGRAVDASLLLALIVGGSLLLAVGEIARGPAAGGLARAIALLGVLVAIDATLRLIPSFFGASPIFALIVLVGYVFGPRFGFLMGSLTLLLSAAITAGVGPWLPFQMLCAGWVGVGAGWLPHPRGQWAEVATLLAFGVAAGFAYGALMNLYSWPFAAPGAAIDQGLFWSPSLSLGESLHRYATFYLATSLAHDASRALANAVLLLVAGPPALRLLRRFARRATWVSTAPPQSL